MKTYSLLTLAILFILSTNTLTQNINENHTAGIRDLVSGINSLMKVDCVDAVAKKAAFVQQVAASLKLVNLQGVHARVENLSRHYPMITSRAFASLADFVRWSAGALAEQGVWLAMKGKQPTEELAALPAGVQVFHVEQLKVPGLVAERCLVWMRPGR